MKATLYKTLSNRQTPIELQAGQTVAAAFPEYDLENAIIVVNGKIVKPDYVLQEKDTVMIRLTPSGTVALAVTLVVVAVVAVAAGVVGGIAAYKAKQAAEEAERELEKVKKLTNKPEVDNRPFLRGASNTDAQGNLLPFMCGYNFFTPYKLSSPFYKIVGTDGVDEYTYTALVCGFNKQLIKKVAIDDVIIKTFSTSAPQEGAYTLDTSIFAEDGRLEIAQDGALLSDLTELNYKTVSNACNDEIPKDTLVSEGTKEYLT
jgi:sulfur carrier protein ThiS